MKKEREQGDSVKEEEEWWYRIHEYKTEEISKTKIRKK